MPYLLQAACLGLKLGWPAIPQKPGADGESARLLVDVQVPAATGTAERDVVPQLIAEARVGGFHPRTLGADKG